jgi:hypothetical protein
MAVERINDLPLTATYLSPGEVFPRSSVDCTRQRQIPKPSIWSRCYIGARPARPFQRDKAIGQVLSASPRISRSFEPNVRWMPVCTIGASTKQRDEAGKIDERDWEIYSLVAPLGCREARTPVSGIQSDLRRRSLARRPPTDIRFHNAFS